MSERITISKVVVAVLVIISFFFLKWLCLPIASIGFASSFIFYGIYLALAIAVIALFVGEDNETGFMYSGVTALIGIVAVLAIAGICAIIGSGLFHSTAKYTQLGKITEKAYVDEISPIDLKQIPYVDVDLAKKLGEKKLGEDATLGSQVNLGAFTKQNVNGQLSLVAPLVHTGFFKYNDNKDGTPGYIIISASNPQDVKLVREINGKEIKIKYQEEAFFGEDLKRHIRNQGFTTEGLTDFSFELDDNGYPYWVITTFSNTTLFGTREATGTIVVDAMTGKCDKYSSSDTPKWVDIIEPIEFVKTQISNFGEYVHGVFNFSNKDKLKVTDGMTTIYNNGSCYYYAGLTSYGSDDATIGFLLVNTRTKEVTKYALSGAQETSAMRSAEGKVQNLGYKAAVPLPINLDGVPTYFMTLKDAEGLIKMYAFVNVKEYSMVGVGDSITSAKSNYSSVYLDAGNKFAFSDEAFEYDLEGKIDRIAFKVENGTTLYTFSLEGKDLLFVAPSTLTEELTITQKGDKVKIKYVDEKNLSVTVSEFDNLLITTRKSNDQTEKENKVDAVTKEGTKVTPVDSNSIKSEWEKLTDEEKAKLLEKTKK
jgi:hypothetical protein